MNLLTKNKIYLTFGGIAGFFMLFALLLLNQGININRHSSEIENNRMPGIIAINAIHTAISDYRAAETLHILSTDPSEMDEYEQTMQQLADEIIAWQSKYEPIISSEKERTFYQKFSKNYESYRVASQQAISLSQNNDNEKATVQLIRNSSLFAAMSGDLINLVELNNQGSSTAAMNGNMAFTQSTIVIMVGSVLMLLILITISYLLDKANINFLDNYLLAGQKKKVSFALLSIAVFFLLFSGLFYQQLLRVNGYITELNTNWVPSIIAINAINSKTSTYRLSEALHLLSSKADEKAELDQEIKVLLNDIANLRNKYSTLISSAAEQSLYQDFSAAYDEYLTTSKQTLDFSSTNDNKQANAQLKQSGILFANFSMVLTDLTSLNERGGIEASHNIDANTQSLKAIILGGSAFVLLLLTITSQLVSIWLLDEPLDNSPENNTSTVLTIKMKLRLAFFAMVGTLVLSSLFFYNLLQTINNQATELEKTWIPNIILVNTLNTMTNNYRLAEAQHILTTSDTDMLRWDKTLHRLTAKITKTCARYEPLISSEEERNIYQTFARKYEEYISKSEKMLALSRRNDNVGAAKEFQHSRFMYDALSIDLRKLVNLNSMGSTDSAQLSKRIIYEAKQIIFIRICSFFMLAILFMIIFEKNISVALQRLTCLMNSLAKGVIISNSTFNNRHDEIGQMAHALSVVTETLQALTNDSIELIDAGKAGILSARVDAQRHPGEFGRIVAGMNSLIDLLSKPLTEVAQIMQSLALGDLAGRMQGDYEGELRILKTNVNRSLDALVGLLTELSLTMQHMSEADLTFSLKGNYQGEFSVLKANTNHTIDYLMDMLKEIAISTAQSAAAITQTSEASKYVADESSKQMYAIENISKTIEETAISVNEIAEKALQSSKLAYSTARFANDGQALLNKLIELIQHIDAEYSRIEQITDQITRIADKTHLLSLNAGLEAMRAGEHGLGFGFVAQQIGLLAEEVSSSARDIGGVISSSGQKIRLGVHATQETQAAMEQISQAAQTSENNVQGISAAIIQQSAAVTSLTQRIGDIRISSEATASAAEEISTTMTHLSQTVQDTASLAKSFKLIEN